VSGRDLVVALGDLVPNKAHQTGNADQQAGTFRHELGHACDNCPSAFNPGQEEPNACKPDDSDAGGASDGGATSGEMPPGGESGNAAAGSSSANGGAGTEAPHAEADAPGAAGNTANGDDAAHTHGADPKTSSCGCVVASTSPLSPLSGALLLALATVGLARRRSAHRRRTLGVCGSPSRGSRKSPSPPFRKPTRSVESTKLSRSDEHVDAAESRRCPSQTLSSTFPATNAHVVQGAIRVRYGNSGWERSGLGYPTTDESPAASGGSITTFSTARSTGRAIFGLTE